MTENFRKSPPESLQPSPFNIENPTISKLDNGLKILLVEDNRHPMVNLRLAFRSGGISDPPGKVGLFSTMTSMLNEGTEAYSSKSLAEEIEKIGARLSASSGFDNSIVSASTLKMHLPKVFDLLAEITLLPTFPEEELALFKHNAIEGLKLDRAQPDFLADEQISRILYGDHPYSKSASTERDIENIMRDDLVRAHEETFVANNATLIAVGDFESDAFLEEITRRFGNWKSREVGQLKTVNPPSRGSRSVTIVDRPGSAQANIILGNLAVKRNHPDYFPTLVMNQILGAGASSRLFMNLREEKGYTYGAYSKFYSKRHLGAFEASAEVRSEVTGESLKEFFFELNRVRDEVVSDDELADAKSYLTGVFPIRAETQSGLTGLIVAKELYDLPENFLDTYRDKVSAVTKEEIQIVAQKYILPDTMAIVIVGDAENILRQAESYSDEIEIFDNEGNAKEIGEFMSNDDAAPANFEGLWNLAIEVMGQPLDIKLSLLQTGDVLSGKLESMLGEGVFDDGKINGNKFSATVNTEFQGQNVTLGVKGTLENDTLGGVISTAVAPEPLEFVGTRSAA